MFYGNERVHHYLEIETEVTGMRLIEPASLAPTSWAVSFELAGSAAVTDPIKYEVALAKVVNWFEIAMRDVLVIPARALTSPLINEIDNLVVMLPGDATDDVLVQALQYKMQAIAGAALHIGKVRIKANDGPAAYHFSPTSTLSLAETASGYTGFESHFDKPWWKRNDSFTYEFLQLDKDNPINYSEMLADHQDPLTEIEEAVSRELSGKVDVLEEAAEILRVEK